MKRIKEELYSFRRHGASLSAKIMDDGRLKEKLGLLRRKHFSFELVGFVEARERFITESALPAKSAAFSYLLKRPFDSVTVKMFLLAVLPALMIKFIRNIKKGI